jgi:hypothetical protein
MRIKQIPCSPQWSSISASRVSDLEPSGRCGGFRGGGLGAIERGKEDLAALATQSSDLAILEKQVTGREIEFWLDLNLQLAR